MALGKIWARWVEGRGVEGVLLWAWAMQARAAARPARKPAGMRACMRRMRLAARRAAASHHALAERGADCVGEETDEGQRGARCHCLFERDVLDRHN